LFSWHVSSKKAFEVSKETRQIPDALYVIGKLPGPYVELLNIHKKY
jgi:hypothetical protein